MILFLHNRYRTTGGEERVVEDLLWLVREHMGEHAELLERSSRSLTRAQAGLGLLRGGVEPGDVGRAVRLGERAKVELSFDAFNLLNRQNVDEVTSVYGLPDFLGGVAVPQHFGDGITPDLAIPGANRDFGKPRTMLNPRQLQFAAKLTF